MKHVRPVSRMYRPSGQTGKALGRNVASRCRWLCRKPLLPIPDDQSFIDLALQLDGCTC